ncbi:nucleotide exchange factor GrpE [Prevotella melaninogenica]|uniref:nucleotide exchange factor GrpE n=1 Tax=Prevotella melaninogenica TaxID=28132 RepID=UPI0001AEA2EF|nr:nucleotide exchange factor GrpE [Prevotella melaninogenica]ADK97349.1 co-chaperone GrpE [Prevotella melaninogenica ATCC 25845]ASE18147.1 nucleotide exchange factor GrpE [Prevotella melaninogenica]UEB09345.1 nucleotide exchange factor GrpE [Prevotella melaninogenica]
MSKKEKNIKIEGEELELNNEETTQNYAEAQAEDANGEETPAEEELDPLVAAQNDAEQWKDKYIRLVAEFENYKKRTLKEKSELILNGSEKTVAAILPILDDFERATADKTEDPQAIKEGYELIYKKFLKALETLGVNKIETDNADFDVDYHEAIAMVPGMGDDKKGKVIDCVQTGYTLNDKVIRHAKVAVGQ